MSESNLSCWPGGFCRGSTCVKIGGATGAGAGHQGRAEGVVVAHLRFSARWAVVDVDLMPSLDGLEEEEARRRRGPQQASQHRQVMPLSRGGDKRRAGAEWWLLLC